MTVVDTQTPRLYRRSLLIAAVGSLRRAWWPVAVTVTVHALLQAAFTAISDRYPGGGIAVALLSAFAVLAAGAVITSAALEATDGPVSFTLVKSRLRNHVVLYVAWTVLVVCAVAVALLWWLLPGLVVLALTPVVSCAAMDGRRDAFVVNLGVIRERIGRWLITVIVMAAIAGGVWLIAVFCGFFVAGWLGSLIVCAVAGVVAAWFQCAWALLYRSTDEGRVALSEHSDAD